MRPRNAEEILPLKRHVIGQIKITEVKKNAEPLFSIYLSNLSLYLTDKADDNAIEKQ